MPHGLTDKECLLITGIFKAWPKVEQVTLFGSRALGNYKTASDIDLSVKGSALSFTDIVMLKSALDDLPLAYKYDVIDYATIKNADLKDHIDQFGSLFYRKE